jgi:hypothetical protein
MRVYPKQDKDELHFSEEPENLRDKLKAKKTYRGRRENQLIDGTARPIQSTLQGVAHRDLLIVLGIVA